MYSLIIKNAHIIDGSGAKPFLGDVAVEGNRIVAIAPQITSGAHEVVNAEGKVLAPGFVDIQNHSDTHWQLFDNPNLDSLLTQGITTIVVGNSGVSLAPLISEQALLSLQKWHTLAGMNVNWRSFEEFASTIQSTTYGCNIASLVGYSTLRRGLVGDRISPLSIEELQSLKKLVYDALSEGAFGVSTGLSYAHESVISEIELFEIAQVSKSLERMMSIHVRDEAGGIVESVREAIAIAQQAKANIKISHLKIRHSRNWPLITEVIDELETAWHQGVNIHFDVYPYTSTWQPLYTYLPTWLVQGGRQHMLEQLELPIQRNKVLTWLNNSEASIKDLIIASTTNNLHITGKSIGTIAADMGTTSEEALLKLVQNGGSEILVFEENMSQENVTKLAEHPLSFIATNGSGYSSAALKKLVHPRCFGSIPKFLREILDGKQIALEAAIRKLTSAPAEKLGLERRGKIAIDFFADLVLFDPKHVGNRATLQNPLHYSTGIQAVWVNGRQATHNGQVIGVLGGQFLIKK